MATYNIFDIESYVDSELEGMLSFKYMKKVKSTVTTIKKNAIRKNVLVDNES